MPHLSLGIGITEELTVSITDRISGYLARTCMISSTDSSAPQEVSLWTSVTRSYSPLEVSHPTQPVDVRTPLNGIGVSLFHSLLHPTIYQKGSACSIILSYAQVADGPFHHTPG